MKQTEYIGVGEISKFKEILNYTKSKKIFLVTGKKSYATSGAQKYFEGINKYAEVFHFDDFASLPKYEDILKGIETYKDFNPDLVVAVGGGSVIDVAKSVNILASQNKTADKYVTGEEKIAHSGKPLVAIPTTAGTGSEATHFAVVYKDGTKYSLASELMLPTFSIVDPTLSFSVPRKTAIACALDALSQSIESFWSTKATDESRGYARQALKSILKNIIPAIEDKNYTAMETLAIGAHLAGKAINISKTTACHAFSYGLTYRFGVPHGIAVAVFLANVYRYNSDINATKSIFKELDAIMGYSDSKKAADALENLIKRLGVAKLSSFGVKASDIISLVSEVNIERLANNPRAISKEDVINFYTGAL